MRLVLKVVMVVLVSVAALVPARAGAATVLGETFAGSLACAAGHTYMNTGAPPPLITVAPSRGVITSWSHLAGPTAETVKFKVLRPTGSPLTWLTVAESGPTVIPANTAGPSPVRIPVQAGDGIAFIGPTDGMAVCARFTDAAYTAVFKNADVPVGASASYTGGSTVEYNLSATLEADADGDGFGDETQDGCPTDATATGACPGLETTITKAPKKKSSKREARFEFTSGVLGATFECAIDGSPFAGCTSPFIRKVKKGGHVFQVRAVLSGRVDATPATHEWKVKKKKKRK